MHLHVVNTEESNVSLDGLMQLKRVRKAHHLQSCELFEVVADAFAGVVVEKTGDSVDVLRQRRADLPRVSLSPFLLLPRICCKLVEAGSFESADMFFLTFASLGCLSELPVYRQGKVVFTSRLKAVDGD